MLLLAVTGAVAAAGAGAAGCAGCAGWGARVPGPPSCVLDIRPPLVGAWLVCPASTILSDTVRLLSLSLSLVIDIEACLHVFLSLRNFHIRLFTVPAPTILVEEGRVCNHYFHSFSVPTEASTGDWQKKDFDIGNSGWWAVEAVKPIKVQRLWATMEASSASETLGHFIFDNVWETWRRAAPTSHTAKRVCVELVRGCYSGHGRTKLMRRALDSWAFPDSGIQVTLISPV